MASIHGALHWAKEHPVPLAIGVFAVGAVVLLLMNSGSSSSSGSSGLSSFYAAQAAQAQSGNSLMATQDQDKTAVALAQIGTANQQALATTAAGVSTANIAANQAVALKQLAVTSQANQQQYNLGVQSLNNQYAENAWNYALSEHAQDIGYDQAAWQQADLVYGITGRAAGH